MHRHTKLSRLYSEQTSADCAGDRLPCDLCQGYTLDMEPNANSASAAEQSVLGPKGDADPSLLGSTYLASQVSTEHCKALAHI